MQTQLRDIEYFAAIVEHGQVQLAAEALGLSQPALSKSLRRLELTMKTKLLKRTPKGVELTSVGSALLAQVRKLRLSLDDLNREIGDLSQGYAGHLRIGCSGGAGIHLVPLACATLMMEAPKLTVRISVSDSKAVLAGLRDGSLDLAVTVVRGLRHEDLMEEHTHDDPWVVYASARHPLAKRRQLTLADLTPERWALSYTGPSEELLTQEYGKRGLPPPRLLAVETTYLPARHQLVAATNLLAIGSRLVVRHAAKRLGIVELRVTDFNVTRRGGVAYRKDAYLSPAARRFIEILKAMAKEIAAEKR
jgi:DNA-binding transcriptional LysR family regulator